MHNITIIGTKHSEDGKCTSDELYKIVEKIRPDVIFDELPKAAFDMYFSESLNIYEINSMLLNRNPPKLPLEVKCLKKYKQHYDVEVLPVDIDVRQRLAKYQDDIWFMNLTFFKREEYQRLDNENDMSTRRDGFDYLNSDKFLEFLDRKKTMEKKIIEGEIEKSRLLNIYSLFHAEQIDYRENAMLQNIHDYSHENQYVNAVFLIGAEHRKSILQKIEERQKTSEIKLNWMIYDNN